jgi:DNA-binding HxlR family transcriptional regulator
MRAARLAIFVFFVGLVSSCEMPGAVQDETAVARVGKSVLTLDQVRSEIPEFLLENDSTAAVQRFVQNWVQREILFQEAKRLGLHEHQEIRNQLRQVETMVLSEALRDLIIANSLEQQSVTEEEVREYYDRNRNQFVLQERHVRLRHLISATLEESVAGKNDLMRGVDWETVAAQYGVDKEETISRSQHFFPVSTLFADNPPMRDYLRVIGISEVSPIRIHRSQFHFIQIVEDRPAGSHPDIDWMFDQIKEWLSIEKRRKAVRAYEQNLLMQAEANNEIEIFEHPQRISIH